MGNCEIKSELEFRPSMISPGKYIAVLIPAFFMAFSACRADTGIAVGADVLIRDRLDLVRGKNIGVITNHTGRLSTGEHIVDALRANGCTVAVLFGPEHGIRGMASAGETVRDTVDPATGIRVFSLYGKDKKPTAAMLHGVDILLYDMQDVGARFYTYISTMVLAMEAAAENDIPFVVLDRPNPLGGELVDGPVLHDSLRSFVGMLPIPVVYGLTCGELAKMVNNERWLPNGLRADLTVVPMEGWSRSMRWSDTGREWLPPSPNIPTPQTAIVYPATCLIEATNLSEGRGTDRPFETIGAPFVDAEALAEALNQAGLSGVQFTPISFTPQSSKFRGEECRGVRLEVHSAEKFQPILTGLHLLKNIQVLHGDRVKFNRSFMARLLGVAGVGDMLNTGHLPQIVEGWQEAASQFRQASSPYFLYSN